MILFCARQVRSRLLWTNAIADVLRVGLERGESTTTEMPTSKRVARPGLIVESFGLVLLSSLLVAVSPFWFAKKRRSRSPYRRCLSLPRPKRLGVALLSRSCCRASPMIQRTARISGATTHSLLVGHIFVNCHIYDLLLHFSSHDVVNGDCDFFVTM